MLLAGKVGYVLKCRCSCELARGVISGLRGGGGHADAENEIGGGVGVLVTRFRGRTAVEHMPSFSAFGVLCGLSRSSRLTTWTSVAVPWPTQHTDSVAAGHAAGSESSAFGQLSGLFYLNIPKCVKHKEDGSEG